MDTRFDVRESAADDDRTRIGEIEEQRRLTAGIPRVLEDDPIRTPPRGDLVDKLAQLPVQTTFVAEPPLAAGRIQEPSIFDCRLRSDLPGLPLLADRLASRVRPPHQVVQHGEMC